MRKHVALFLVLFLALSQVSFVSAENIDITELDYAEKLALYQQLQEYFDDSVLLPEGIYHVGTDIKPGWYKFSYGTTAVVAVRIGNALNVTKTDIDYHKTTVDQSFELWNPTKDYYFHLNMAHTYKELKQGQYIIVENGNIMVEPWNMK